MFSRITGDGVFSVNLPNMLFLARKICRFNGFLNFITLHSGCYGVAVLQSEIVP